MLTYAQEESISAEEFIEVLNNSTLGERRPVHDESKIKLMIEHANLIITARDNGKLVGIARSFSDFAFCTYMSDLAVDLNYQKKGIGKELIKKTKDLSPDATLILIAAPAAEQYYPRIGMTLRKHCFILNEVEALK